jgi:hypothetical protein
MNNTQPFIYRLGYWCGTAFQFIGYALVVIGIFFF